MMNKKNPLVHTQNEDDSFKMVAAIEVGTSYSGYAYCAHRKGKSIANNVMLNPVWVSSDKSTSLRVPTCLLLNEIKEFEAFGYEAEKRYLKLLKDGKTEQYFFFRRFKMKLHGKGDLSSKSLLKDEGGKVLPAIKVFSTTIRFLKSHLLHDMCIRGMEADPEEIRWVLPVPAFWNDLAKQFFRKTAEQAGIPGENLVLALEPEAASLFCQNVTLNKPHSKLSITAVGTKYMVADLGGGTADIIIHEKQKAGLKEVCRGNGGLVGGRAVDSVFIQFLVKMLGEDIILEFFDKHRADSLALLREFEVAKRRVTPRSSCCLEMKVPNSLDELCKNMRSQDDLDACIKKSVYKDRVTLRQMRIRIDAVVSNEFFRATSLEIVKLVKTVLASKSAEDVKMLVVTGGFADSLVLQEIFHQELITTKTKLQEVIFPSESEIAVLKGAVIYGHNPAVVTSRVNRYTLGMRLARLYNPEIHPTQRRVLIHGSEYIIDTFSPFLTLGTRVPRGFISHQSLTTTEPMQKKIEIDVFFSYEIAPSFVSDESCERMGKVEFRLPTPSQFCRTIYVDLQLGGTELVMYVTDKSTAERKKLYFPPIEQ